jgi:hypothetical protein
MTLIIRYCSCLCGKWWKCTPDSPNWFWSLGHVENAEKSGLMGIREKAAQYRAWRQGITKAGRTNGIMYSHRKSKANTENRRIANLFLDFEIERAERVYKKADKPMRKT